jgi:hypothetical protein
VGLTTRPPGATPGVGLTEPPAPVLRELRAIVDELRALAGAAAASRGLPPLPELRGAAPEPALARWFRAALESGPLAAAALRDLVEQAVQRLAAGGSATAPEGRPLEGARYTALRLLSAAAADVAAGLGGAVAPAPAAMPAAVDRTLALRVLAEEVRRAVVQQIGAEPPFVAPPAAAEDPGNAGAALLGWLRTAAAREIGRAHV